MALGLGLNLLKGYIFGKNKLAKVSFSKVNDLHNKLGTGYDWPWVLGFDLAKIFWSMP